MTSVVAHSNFPPLIDTYTLDTDYTMARPFEYRPVREGGNTSYLGGSVEQIYNT